MASTSQLPISNVINVSVSTAQTGLGQFNTSNLALFTTDFYPASWSGSPNSYALYLSPSQLGSDFGTTSNTYLMGNAVFSQQPNILSGGGYLAAIPLIPSTQTVTFSGAPASGSFNLLYAGSQVTIAWNASATAIQSSIQAVFPGLAQAQVAGSIGSGTTLTISMYGYYGTPAVFTTGSNGLQTSGAGSVTITNAVTGSGETLSAAITRTSTLVQYFGVMSNVIADTIGSAGVTAAAATIQALNKIQFQVWDVAADLTSPGVVQSLAAAGYTQTRSLYYNDGTGSDALVFMAGYASRGMSTNFNGANTCSTMHLKQITGTQPDPSVTQTVLNNAGVAGADVYVSLQGVPATFTSGANQYFDQVYDLQAFVGALQVAGFNYLAQSNTKIPQTEQGMSGLKAAYRAVCTQFQTNGFIAPGSWTSSTTFGNQTDFTNNINQLGYYIYSAPVSQQAAAARAARQAPLVQIAVKLSGALQSSSVVIYVNQ